VGGAPQQREEKKFFRPPPPPLSLVGEENTPLLLSSFRETPSSFSCAPPPKNICLLYNMRVPPHWAISPPRVLKTPPHLVLSPERKKFVFFAGGGKTNTPPPLCGSPPFSLSGGRNFLPPPTFLVGGVVPPRGNTPLVCFPPSVGGHLLILSWVVSPLAEKTLLPVREFSPAPAKTLFFSKTIGGLLSPHKKTPRRDFIIYPPVSIIGPPTHPRGASQKEGRNHPLLFRGPPVSAPLPPARKLSLSPLGWLKLPPIWWWAPPFLYDPWRAPPSFWGSPRKHPLLGSPQ